MGIAEYLDQHEMHDDHKKLIKDIETYLSDDSEHKIKNEDFEGYKGGVKQLTHDLYDRGMNFFQEHKKDLEGSKTDEEKKNKAIKAVDKLLDEIVVETAAKLTGNEDAVQTAKAYKLRKENGMYEGEVGSRQMQKKMLYMAQEHLGLNLDQFKELSVKLQQALLSGEEGIYRDAITDIEEALKKNMHEHRINKIENTLQNDEEALLSANVHYWNDLKGEHGVVPQKLEQVYESHPVNIKRIRQRLDGLKNTKERNIEDIFKEMGLETL